MLTNIALALILAIALFATVGVVLRAPALFTETSMLVKAGIVDPVQLEKHVVVISEQLGPRDFSNLQGLKEVSAYIFSEFDIAGGQPEYQDYLEVLRLTKMLSLALGLRRMRELSSVLTMIVRVLYLVPTTMQVVLLGFSNWQDYFETIHRALELSL